MAISAYVPCIFLLEERFPVSQQVINLGLSLFLLGLAIGPLPIGPLSELLGRQATCRYALLVLIVFTIGAACAQNIETLIICRTLGAFGGSGAMAVIGGSVLDLWDMNKGGGLAAVSVTITPYMGPVLGPAASAYIIAEYNNNWRFALWMVVFLAVPIAVLSFFLKETYKPKILRDRAAQRGESQQPAPNKVLAIRHILLVAFTRPAKLLLTEPLVAFLGFYTSFTYVILVSFFSSYPYVFEIQFSFSNQTTSLAFLGVLVGLLLGTIVFVICEGIAAKMIARAPAGPPPLEAHLLPALVGSILLPTGLFWFAWSSTRTVHWIVPILAGLPFGCATSSIYFTVIVYLGHVYRSDVSASVLAAVGLLRYSLAATPPHFIIPMYMKLGPQWAGSVFAFLSVALLPVPWVFYKWGHILRSRSRYTLSGMINGHAEDYISMKHLSASTLEEGTGGA
jgi:MFS family permease